MNLKLMEEMHFSNNVSNTMIYTKQNLTFDILSILVRWRIFMSDMCQYLAANFRTTTIPAVSGSTTLPHSVAFFVATRPHGIFI
jgi:hypothetical protein